MSLQTKKIFILDDDNFLLNMYASKFKSEGLETMGFSSGEEVVKKLKEGEKVDAILLDVIIPGLSGLETLEIIRKEKLAGDAKIIMLTNQSDNTEMEKAKNLGIDGYIIKATATPSEVVEQVLNIMKK